LKKEADMAIHSSQGMLNEQRLPNPRNEYAVPRYRVTLVRDNRAVPPSSPLTTSVAAAAVLRPLFAGLDRELRSFMAVLGDQDVGLFVSAGGFTREAENEARTQEKRKITLLGLEQFFDLWLEHYAKVEEADRQLLPLKPVYFLAPSK
jgi:hypothetical protein